MGLTGKLQRYINVLVPANPFVAAAMGFAGSGWQRPRAQLYSFNLRQPIPDFPLPLLPKEEQPIVHLIKVVHDLYTRARFDLRLDYSASPVPPLSAEDGQWAANLVKNRDGE